MKTDSLSRGRAGWHATIRAAVKARRAFRHARCRLFERCGSSRYSRTALYELDAKLAGYLADDGIFVEAGAHDGYRQSNTYYLERFRGWTGILIEPIPALAMECRKRRRRSRVYQCALVAADHPTSEVVMSYADAFSEVRTDGVRTPQGIPEWYDRYEVAVPARTMSDVLADAKPPRIDFLSLDLEGSEAAALSGLDFDQWSPTIMLIEIVDDEAQRAVEAVLPPYYERVGRLTVHDVLYRRRR